MKIDERFNVDASSPRLLKLGASVAPGLAGVSALMGTTQVEGAERLWPSERTWGQDRREPSPWCLTLPPAGGNDHAPVQRQAKKKVFHSDGASPPAPPLSFGFVGTKSVSRVFNEEQILLQFKRMPGLNERLEARQSLDQMPHVSPLGKQQCVLPTCSFQNRCCPEVASSRRRL